MRSLNPARSRELGLTVESRQEREVRDEAIYRAFVQEKVDSETECSRREAVELAQYGIGSTIRGGS